MDSEYEEMLEHLARFVEICPNYGMRVMRLTLDDDNDGIVPLTRSYLEEKGVPFMAVIKNTDWLAISPADII